MIRLHRMLRTGCAAALATLCLSASSHGDEVGAASAGDAGAQATLTIYKSPSCGCCTKWADYLTANGFAVTLRDTHDLAAIKDRLGVPRDMRSCHTATVGAHVIEGHVPVADIRRFLTSTPGGLLAVPGMPLGSPGMEHPSGSMPYDSLIVGADGRPRVFAHHPAP